ncbi:ROK family protein [Agromyces albus]|nr:ROK family protein [Agromyces albus]
MIASTLARLIASGTAATKADLVRTTGLARTTVDTGLRALFELGAIRMQGFRAAVGRGRPAEVIEIEPSFGATIVLDFGGHSVRLSIADLGQNVLAHDELPVLLAAGPESVLSSVLARAHELVNAAGLAERHRVTVVGVPGPVNAREGSVVRPPIMPGWDGFPIVERVRESLGGRVLLVNDVNLRALGEARAIDSAGSLIYLKVGTGIGAGIVDADGRLVDGADGAAGDVGHVRSPGSTTRCGCGADGCLEATASVTALATRAASLVGDGADAADRFLTLLHERDPQCVELVVDGAAAIGEVVSMLVHVVNPSRIVIGGSLDAASDDLLAGIRRVVYGRALPLATRNLTIAHATLGGEAGMAGGIVLGVESAFDADRLEELLERRARALRAAALHRGREFSGIRELPAPQRLGLVASR